MALLVSYMALKYPILESVTSQLKSVHEIESGD